MSLHKNKGFNEYDTADRIYRLKDKWQKKRYATVQAFIEKHLAPTVTEDSFILNAASVGNSYGLPKKNMQHFDVASGKIAYLSNAQTGSMKNILFSDDIYDIIVCTGSALNNTDPMKAFEEFKRILRPKGLLIVEFENSNTIELLLKKDFNRKAVFVNSYCAKQQRWHYSDSWINELLVLNKFETIRKRKFHYFHPLTHWTTAAETKARISFGLDPLFRLVPFARNLASHTVILCQKNPD